MKQAKTAALAALILVLSSCGEPGLTDEQTRTYASAVGAYQAGDFARVVDLASALETEAPRFAKSALLRGKALWFSGSGDEALAALDKAIKIDGLDQEAWLWKAKVLRSLGRAEEAGLALDPVLSRDPEDFRLHYLKAQLLLDADDTQAGIAFLDKAIESGSELALAYMERGRIAYLLGQIDQARRYLDVARALSQDSPGVLKAIDGVLAAMGGKDSE